MAKMYLNPKELFNSLQHGFSQVVTTGLGRSIYLSGQVAYDNQKRLYGKDDLATQCQKCLDNIALALQAANAKVDDIVSIRIYVLSEELKLNGHLISEVLKGFFTGGKEPAATWLGVASLAEEDMLIEIEAVAVVENA